MHIEHVLGKRFIAPNHTLCTQSSCLQGDEQRVDFPLESRLDSIAKLLANIVHGSLPGILLLDQRKSSL